LLFCALLCAVLLPHVVAAAATTAGGGQLVSSASLSELELRILTTAGTEQFARRAAMQYTLQRTGEIRVVVELVPTVGITASATPVAFSRLAAGEADAAVLPFTPSQAQLDANPDLAAYPVWATAFAPVLNVPGLTATLKFNLVILARIYNGNITM
jgi:hypothetical protein